MLGAACATRHTPLSVARPKDARKHTSNTEGVEHLPHTNLTTALDFSPNIRYTVLWCGKSIPISPRCEVSTSCTSFG